jgi:hypothetical protein
MTKKRRAAPVPVSSRGRRGLPEQLVGKACRNFGELLLPVKRHKSDAQL